ncbi:transcription termination factor 2-like [Venturia canescens]|uniref:transcription termination factor 2-like n=1 Tax=Venturia canescens TaxID=32260 RepID=UPI001C9C90A3|nr:transcription termination factor 2-like [Venturia canescens]
MAESHNSSYSSSGDEDSESFIISNDSSDEDDKKIVISESSANETDNNESTKTESTNGRITPLIHKAIRRSLHHFKQSSNDETENLSTENLTNSPILKSKNSSQSKITPRKGYSNSADSSDEEEDISTRMKTHSATSSEQETSSNLVDSCIQIPANHKHSNKHYTDSETNDSVVRVRPKPKHIHHLESSSETDDDSPESHVISTDEDDEEESKNLSLSPKLAQRKAYLEAQLHQVDRQLTKSKMLLNSGNLGALHDKGEKIRQNIITQETKLADIQNQLQYIEDNAKKSSAKLLRMQEVKKSLFKEGSLEIDPTFLKPTTSSQQIDLGKKALKTFQKEQELTVDRLKDLHGSLLSRPEETQLADDPRGLKVKLMPHQKYALTWLLWREQQNPAGGVLADDMGLGKTLTMISLVVTAKQIKDAADDSDEENEKWLSSARTQRHLGGTLVVAPASLVAQWQSEVKNRCKSRLLTVELFHGNNRESNPKRLARNDIVVTTYNIISREFKTSGVLYKIHWKRVILDEAHVIRNHKSLTCEAVCGISASKRWVLTGTPVHNKEMDLFSLLKFLKCSPFDDVRVWKRWVDNKNVAGSERLSTVMKSIMLRRTKQELQENGSLDVLPEKLIETIEVKLDPDERLVYDKVLVFSRTLFAQFLAQRAEKAHMQELGTGMYDKPSWQMNHKDTQFTKAQKKLLSMHADVAAHDILVLLLRLRQLCCHSSLIHSMLDRQDIEENSLHDMENPAGLATRLADMSLHDDDGEDEGEIGVDERVAEHLLTSNNPVFDRNRQSSKLKVVMKKIKEIVTDNDDKLIVVSQWTSVLELVADNLKDLKKVSYRMFTGKVPVKDRQGIMDDFNSRYSETNVLLLSLTAGGVGLNLVGANHLLLLDIHWNPQLENQAQDRIYRFGQKKDVYIYKYICSDTIEERIKALQEHKLAIADSLLSGSGKAGASKLSLDEMKMLFGI